MTFNFRKVLILVLSISALAQQKSGRISPLDILRANLQATGNDARISTHSWRIRGTIGSAIHPGSILGSFEFRSEGSDRAVLQVDTISHGTFIYGRNASGAFTRLTPEGVGMFNGITVMAMERDLEAITSSKWDLYKEIRLAGIAKDKKSTALAVLLSSKEGDKELRYFDEASNLLVRIERTQQLITPDKKVGAYAVDAEIEDYRDWYGVQLPRLIRYRALSGDIGLRIQRVERNVELPPHTFEAAR
jgi:hypothetical protein